MAGGGDTGPSSTPGDEEFCIVVSDSGTFTTLGGTTTPDGSGTLDAGITGNIQGGYFATAVGTLDPSPDYATSSSLGVFDLDLTGSPAHPSFLSYIDVITVDNHLDHALPDWGWIYKAARNGTWVNQSSGNQGNITG